MKKVPLSQKCFSLLRMFWSCKEEAITELVKKEFICLWIGHLQTDGLIHSWGKCNGWTDLSRKIRQSNGKLFDLHCVCHCTALACTDSCEELKLIKEVGEVLRKLWYYFHK